MAQRASGPTAKLRIVTRIRRLELGNPGEVKPVGERVSEMRLPCGPGYRLYFIAVGDTVVILLCGGDKSSLRRRQISPRPGHRFGKGDGKGDLRWLLKRHVLTSSTTSKHPRIALHTSTQLSKPEIHL
ncbi:type II toxin-antitoxin system RelE/ParE family toxin [Sinorhizobium meliloti]|uniref:type II toxin-antitoxin system RelE/ParE family toxin n=1 Tax=Rhizobium meliloti TaxID=382 RepID=UPI00399AD2CD